MNFNFLKYFARKAGSETARLENTADPQAEEVAAMSRLITAAYGTQGIKIASRMPDDSHTPVSAKVAATQRPGNPELAARMAEASLDLAR